MPHADTTSTPRRRRRAARIEQILATALEIIGEGGPGALTIARLADELDYTVGALYRYFPSKDALLAELERRAISEIAARIEAELGRVEAASESLSAQAKALAPLLALARAYGRLPLETPQRFALVSQNLASPEQVLPESEDPAVVEVLMPTLRAVAERLESAATAGALEPGPASERAMVLWSGLHGATALRKVKTYDPDFAAPRSLGRATARTLLRGWGAAEDSLDEAARLVDSIGAER